MPVMDDISLALRRLMILNRRHDGTARRGLIVSGPPTTGKTTALQQLGRAFHLAERRRRGSETDEGRLPVAFVAVPPAATPKMLVSEFARFLGLPVAARMNQARSPMQWMAPCAIWASAWASSTTSISWTPAPVPEPRRPTR
jgi:hypothetical protein